MRSVRDERMKLIEYRTGSGPRTQLFDTSADPLEVNDLSQSPRHKSDLRRLRSALARELPSGDPFVTADL